MNLCSYVLFVFPSQKVHGPVLYVLAVVALGQAQTVQQRSRNRMQPQQFSAYTTVATSTYGASRFFHAASGKRADPCSEWFVGWVANFLSLLNFIAQQKSLHGVRLALPLLTAALQLYGEGSMMHPRTLVVSILVISV